MQVLPSAFHSMAKRADYPIAQDKSLDELLSPKQQSFMFCLDHRLNFLIGSVRSGKTYVSLLKFSLRVRYSSEDSTFMFCGRTLTTLKRNCLIPLQSLIGEDNFWFSVNAKQGVLFGHTVFLESATDESAEEKIRGITLDGAYCDEATLFPQSFFKMLLSRLSRPGANMYATTNPDAPTHWLKKDYIDRESELDCRVWNFTLEDNTFLDAKFIENLKLEYTGVFYQRFILGLWVVADGLVFPAFDEGTMLIPTPTRQQIQREYAEIYVSIDYGIENPTAFGLYGWNIKLQEWHKLRDYHYGGVDGVVPKTDPEIYKDLLDFCAGYEVLETIIDPSAASLKLMIQKDRRLKVRDADNDVVPGISFTNTMFRQEKLKICDCCKSTLEELYAYSWDTEKSRETGKDIVIKKFDHNMDEMRYFCNTIVKPKTKLYGVVFTSYDKIGCKGA